MHSYVSMKANTTKFPSRTFSSETKCKHINVLKEMFSEWVMGRRQDRDSLYAASSASLSG